MSETIISQLANTVPYYLRRDRGFATSELTADFTLQAVANTVPDLTEKLDRQLKGWYGAGVTEQGVSWLSLKGVGLDDPRINEIASLIGASTTEVWDTHRPLWLSIERKYADIHLNEEGDKLLGVTTAKHRVFMLGAAAGLHAMQLNALGSPATPRTYLSIDLSPLPKH